MCLLWWFCCCDELFLFSFFFYLTDCHAFCLFDSGLCFAWGMLVVFVQGPAKTGLDMKSSDLRSILVGSWKHFQPRRIVAELSMLSERKSGGDFLSHWLLFLRKGSSLHVVYRGSLHFSWCKIVEELRGWLVLRCSLLWKSEELFQGDMSGEWNLVERAVFSLYLLRYSGFIYSLHLDNTLIASY